MKKLLLSLVSFLLLFSLTGCKINNNDKNTTFVKQTTSKEDNANKSEDNKKQIDLKEEKDYTTDDDTETIINTVK